MENSITKTYHISGMGCGGCVTSVKSKLSAAAGVTSVKIDLAKNEAEITSDKVIKMDTLQSALTDSGYGISELNIN